jgi:formylmethanofuran dehydrogenase subunit C
MVTKVVVMKKVEIRENLTLTKEEIAALARGESVSIRVKGPVSNVGYEMEKGGVIKIDGDVEIRDDYIGKTEGGVIKIDGDVKEMAGYGGKTEEGVIKIDGDVEIRGCCCPIGAKKTL